jgi:hypothetical protein
VQLAQRACQLTQYQRVIFIGTLAAAYAEAGDFDNAAQTAEQAVTLATAQKNQALMQKNRELLELYHQQKAYHEPAMH